MKYILVAVLFSLISCVSIKNKRMELDESIGWVHGNCFAIKNSNLKENEPIKIIDIGKGNAKSKTSIKHRVSNSDECVILLADREKVNRQAGYSFYTIADSFDISAAILPSSNLDSLVFSECNTQEGIALFAHKGKHKVWQGYYYLGYDLTPTCSVDEQ